MSFKSKFLVTLLLSLWPLGAWAQAGRLALPDFSALAKKASQSVNVSLDASMLGLATGLLSADPGAANVKDVVAGLQGIYVRSYRFDHEGAYSRADVAAIRAQLVAPTWVPLVATHDQRQGSDVDIYVSRHGNQTDGMAILTAQPRQLTIVNLVGPIDLAKLAQLQGRFGIPNLRMPSGATAGSGKP